VGTWLKEKQRISPTNGSMLDPSNRLMRYAVIIRGFLR